MARAIRVSDRATTIYGLSDPRTGEIRYVGKTLVTPYSRLQRHTWAAKSKNYRRKSLDWINSVVAAGHTPAITVLEVVPPSGDWAKAERAWIAHFLAAGARLCNLSSGGEGPCGPVWPDEASRAKAIAKATATLRRPEHVERTSRESRQRWAESRDYIIARQNEGRGAEWKRNNSERMKLLWRKPNSPCVAAMVARQKILDRDIPLLKQMVADGVSRGKAAASFGISRALASMIVSGKRRA